MKLAKYSLIMASVLFILMSVAGCVLSHYVTPAEIDKNAQRYVIAAGVADANDFAGWHNLIMAAKLKELVDIASMLTQQRLDQMKDQDALQHAIHQKVTTNNYQKAIKTEELLFGETGILSLVMGMTGMGALTGVLGLSRKRPQDVTPQEMEQALAQATNKTAEELTLKEKQLIQIVKGIQNFKAENADRNDVLEGLKKALLAAQDTDTKAAVAVVKAKEIG